MNHLANRPRTSVFCITMALCLLAVPANSASVSAPHFEVSKADELRYRVYQIKPLRLIIVKFDAREIFPAATGRLVLGRVWYGQPNSAVVQIGSSERLLNSRKKGPPICGVLFEIYPFSIEPMPPNLLADLSASPRPMVEERYYASSDKKWIARCIPSLSTCSNVFSEGVWSSRFTIDQKNICEAPNMNKRLGTLIARWLK